MWNNRGTARRSALGWRGRTLRTFMYYSAISLSWLQFRTVVSATATTNVRRTGYIAGFVKRETHESIRIELSETASYLPVSSKYDATAQVFAIIRVAVKLRFASENIVVHTVPAMQHTERERWGEVHGVWVRALWCTSVEVDGDDGSYVSYYCCRMRRTSLASLKCGAS